MNTLIKFFPIFSKINIPILIRQLADSLTIYLACLASIFVFLQDLKANQIFIPSLSLFILLFLVFIPSFYFTGIYTYARHYNNKKKFLAITKASLITGSFLILIFLVFNYYFNQNFKIIDLLISDISIAWLLTIVGVVTSRLLVYTYTDSQKESVSFGKDNKRILVIGGAGYIGSSLVSQLLEKNYKVRVLDIFLFGQEPIAEFINHPNLEIIKGDFRKVDDLCIAITDCYAVVHLGGIVGDPACSIDEKLTIEVNLTATKVIGQIAKSVGVKKFIFASSCSVYGAQDSLLNEYSDTYPMSLYAKTKITSEQILSKLSDENFSPIFLRFGTVYGLSGRTRFDLVVNLLTANAYTKKQMTVYGKDQIRPFIHVSDAAYSVLCALESQFSKKENLIFNIGSNPQNCSLIHLAELIKKYIPEAEIIVEGENNDARNYNVTFDKAKKMLNFKTKWSLEEGIKQVIAKFKDGKIKDFTQAKYSNAKHLHEEGLKVLNEHDTSSWEEMLLDETYV